MGCCAGSDVSCFGVEAEQEFVCDGDAGDFGRLSGEGEALVEGGEVGLVACGDAGDDEEDFADRCATSADGAFSAMVAAVAVQRGEAGRVPRHGLRPAGLRGPLSRSTAGKKVQK